MLGALGSQKSAIRSSGVKKGCEAPSGCWKLKLGPLLTSEPSPQPALALSLPLIFSIVLSIPQLVQLRICITSVETLQCSMINFYLGHASKIRTFTTNGC